MRRILPILLMLVLSLGPTLAAVPANAPASGWTGTVDESRLPACCRRHGAHHCAAMGLQASTPLTQPAGSLETSVSASTSCPCCPQVLASTAAPLVALESRNTSLRVALERRPAHQVVIAAGASARRTWPKRGPPSQNS